MLIKKLKLNYFGRFQNREIDLRPGINLIYGENEAGKSTVHTFIKGMLFGIERLRGRGAASKEDVYTKYLPWDYPGAYSGQMDLVVNNKVYRLIRSFHTSDKGFRVLDVGTGREFTLSEGKIAELIPGLTEGTYRNTVSIEQLKAATDGELASQVRNYITNLSIAKSNEVNVSKTLGKLSEKRKALENRIHKIDLEELKKEIEEGILREQRMEQLTEELHSLMREEPKILAEKESTVTYLQQEDLDGVNQFPAIMEKYRQYRELFVKTEKLHSKREEWTSGLIQYVDYEERVNQIQTVLKKATELVAEIPEIGKKRSELEVDKQKFYKRALLRSFLLSLSPVILTLILNDIILKNRDSRLVISFLAFGAGIILLLAFSLRMNQKKKVYDQGIQDAMEQMEEKEGKLQAIYQSYNIGNLHDLSLNHDKLMKRQYQINQGKLQLQELNKQIEEQEDRTDFLQDEIMGYMQSFISEDVLTDQAMFRLKQAIEQRKKDGDSHRELVQSRWNEYQSKLAKLQWEIESLEENEETLVQNKDKYSTLLREKQEAEVELSAIKLAIDTIQSLSAAIHDGFGKKLNQRVSKRMDEVTNHKYQDLKLDEALNVKIGWNGEYLSLDRLSAGTMDQVYLALRLAVSDLLTEGEELPIILDDSFALYDDQRLAATLKILGDRQQVLIFSCHKREQKILEEKGIPYHYVDLSHSN